MKKTTHVGFLQKLKISVLIFAVFATQFSAFAAPVEVENATQNQNEVSALTTTEGVVWNQTDWSEGRGISTVNQFSTENGLIWDAPGQLTIDFSYNQNLEGTGDVNQNGTVTVLDGQTILNFIDGKIDITIDEQQIGDVDNDNRHTILDVQAIANRATGILSELPIMIGDVNRNGVITSADAQMALQISVESLDPTDYQRFVADVNFDGKVTAVDAQIILNKAVGIVKCLPYLNGQDSDLCTKEPKFIGSGTLTSNVFDGGAEITWNRLGIIAGFLANGDIDQDGVVQAVDGLYAMRYWKGEITLTPEQKLIGDVDQDGIVTKADSIMILRKAVGSVPTLPITFGDLNGDDKITAADALIVQKHVSGESVLIGEKLFLADVNIDEQVNSADVDLIMKRAVGVVKCLPVVEGVSSTECGELGGLKNTPGIKVYAKASNTKTGLNNKEFVLVTPGNLSNLVGRYLQYKVELRGQEHLILKEVQFNGTKVVTTPGNNSPIWEGPNSVKRFVGTEMKFTVTAEDSDGDSLKITYDIPNGATYNIASGEFKWTSDVEKNASARFYASDGKATTTKNIDLEFYGTLPENKRPVITVIGNDQMEILKGTNFVDPGATASDSEDGDITDEITKKFLFNGSEVSEIDTSKTGTYTIVYTVIDSGGKSDTESRIVLVTLDPNRAPIIDGPILAKAHVGDPIRFTLNISDPDGDPVTVTHTIPDGATFNKQTGEFYWLSNSVSEFRAIFIASDGKLSTTHNVVMGVFPRPNVKPVITLLGASPLEIAKGQNFTDPGATAADTEDGNITHKITKTIKFNGQIVGSVNTNNVGEYKITYNVLDSKDLAADSVTRTVIVFDPGSSNRAPRIEAPDTLIVFKNQLVNFEVIASDPDGDDVTLTSTKLPSGSQFIKNDRDEGTFNWIPTASTTTTAEFDATDGVLTTKHIVAIQVLEPDQCKLVAYARVVVEDFENRGTGNFQKDIYVGTKDNRIEAGAWFPLLNNNENYIVDARAEDFASEVRGLAVERGDGTIKVALYGFHDLVSGQDIFTNSEYVKGYVELKYVSASSTVSAAGDYKMDPQDSTNIATPTKVNFDMIVNVAADAFIININNTNTSCPIPNTAPVLNLTGSSSIQINKGQNFTDPGATAIDSEDGNLTDRIIKTITFNGTTTQSIDTNNVGEYRITYTVTDNGGLSDSEVRVLVVVDPGTPGNNPPVIQGPNEATTTVGVEIRFTVTASDPDSDPVKVTFEIPSGATYSTTTGEFRWTPTLTGTTTGIFFATDNKATTTKNVLLTVFATTSATNTPPTITLVGSNSVEVDKGQNFTDQGATATDSEDGNITSRIVRRVQFQGQTVDNVNTNNNGDYLITYSVTDNGGLSASTTRSVRVKDAPSTGGPGCGSCGGGGVPTLPEPLRINNLQITQVIPGSALITWNTNLPATSRVVFDTNSISTPTQSLTNLGYRSTSATFTNLTTAHQVTILNLPQGQTQYFRPISTTTNETAIGNEVFLTPGGVVIQIPTPTPTNPVIPANPGGPIIIIDNGNPVVIVDDTDTAPTTTLGIVKIKKSPVNLAAALFGIPFALDEILKCLYLLILVLALTYIIVILSLENKRFRAWTEKSTSTPEMSLWAFLLSLALIASFFFEILRCIQIPLAVILLILAIYLGYKDYNAKHNPNKSLTTKGETRTDIKTITKTETKFETKE